MKKENPNYNMFNGRREADKYVKGWLKAVTGISGAGLLLAMSFGGWLVVQVADLNGKHDNHEVRLVTIEASRFSMTDGQKLTSKIAENAQNFTRLEGHIRSLADDMAEIKDLLKRRIP